MDGAWTVRTVACVSLSLLCVAIISFDIGFDPFVHATSLSLGDSNDNDADAAAAAAAANTTAEAREGEVGAEGGAAGAGAPMDTGVGAPIAPTGNLFDRAGFSSPTTGAPTAPCSGRRGVGSSGGVGDTHQEHCTLRSWIKSDLDPWRHTVGRYKFANPADP
jgi:hypothetical protein